MELLPPEIYPQIYAIVLSELSGIIVGKKEEQYNNAVALKDILQNM